MTLEQARKAAQEDADNYLVDINIIYDKLSEYPLTDDGEDNCYSFCSVEGMDIMYPPYLKDYWIVIGFVRPTRHQTIR